MGGQTDTTDDLWARAKANGYQQGAHAEVDEVRGGEKYVVKTKKDHDRTLRRYIQWRLGTAREDHERKGLPPPDEDGIRGQYLGKGVAAPALVTVKDFLRFYIATSHPQIDKKVPTADTICTVGEWFFAGFTRVSGTETKAEDRSEVYYWIRRTLTLEGIVINKHRPKHNFTVRDLTRVLLALWTYDDLIFIHERYRVQATFLIHVYCWTGARIDAFFKDGLRYRDVELILQRDDGSDDDSADGRGWRLVYKIDQRWVKNNRDPENITFGAAAKEHKRLFYNDAGFFLVMALADGALFGYNTLDDIRQQVIPTGQDEVILRFNDSALDRPILRKCTKAGGVTDEPMTKAAFLDILRSTLINAGYFCGASIHAIRRHLGKGIDKRNTEVERSQHLTQADPRVFGQSYVANCSSVDGQAAFRDEVSDQRHIEYFQSLEKFHEDGLPDKLPAHLEEELKQDPQLRELEAKMGAIIRGEGNNQDFSTAKRQLTTYSRKLKRYALRLYQETWVQERRDWKVLTRGKEVAQDHSKTELAQDIYRLFPERGRLAERMTSTHSLTSDEMWDSLRDLYSLCLPDASVLYLPGSRPVDSACPVKGCQRHMNSLLKSQRNQHIQNCVRREMAARQARLLSDVHYCYHCFDWVVGDGWEAHCQTHLDALTVKRCGSVTHCHTLVRPAYCPFCIGDVSLPPSERLKSWSRDHKLWVHVNEEHLNGCQWPLVCSHPLCDSTHDDFPELQFHLMDVHKFSRSRPNAGTKPCRQMSSDEKVSPGEDADALCRKRRSPNNFGAVKWQPPQSLNSMTVAAAGRRPDCPRKRQRPSPPPSSVYPAVILIDDDRPADDSTQSAAASIAHFPPGHFDVEDARFFPSLECGSFPSECTSVQETTRSMEPTDSDDGSDLDDMFKQYLRSLSSSPQPSASPDVAGSEMSGETLINSKHDQSCDSPHLHVEPLSETTSEGIPAGQVDRDLSISQVASRPRIRLRMSQPKITLRLTLPAARQPRKGGKTGKTGVGKKSGRRKGSRGKT